MHKNSVRSFHFDCTYKCVSPTPNKYRLLVLSGYDNISKKTVLCSFILCEDEKSITFENIFKILKNEPYYFDPYYLMCDFAKGQIIAAKKIFPNSLLNCCFFHFSQIIWIKFKFYGMAGKGKYEFNLTLLFNIQLLCFIKPDLVKYLYNKIKKKFDVKQFFIYFNRNWLKTKYPIKLWNYYDKLNNANDNELDRYILTNNINENINRYLNNSLSKSRASYEDFVKSLEEVEKQFAIKLENSSNNNAKSKIILFYINKIKLN